MANRILAAALSPVFFSVFLALTSAPAGAASSAELVTAVKNVAAQTDKLRSMMADLSQSQFQIVNAQSVMSAGDEAQVRAALRKNAADVSDMRETLSHTTLTGNDGVIMPFSKLLQAQNLKIAQVIGIYVNGNQITVFYQ